MPDKPNVLFIFTDEQRFDTLACYGNSQIHMPHLNALADQSVVFEQAYITQPLCTPSRASIMTGKWPHQTDCNELDVIMPDEHRCLPEYFVNADGSRQYAGGYHGKWHLGDELFAQHGFDDWQAIEDGYGSGYREGRDPATRSAYWHWLIAKGHKPSSPAAAFSRNTAARFAEADGKPSFLGESASKFITQKQNEPWMLYVNFLEPHMPFFGPRDDQYDPADMPLPENFDFPPTDDHPLKSRMLRDFYYEHGHSGLPLKTTDDWRRMIANYWGLCSLVDTHVGRILQALRDSGQWDNTIIVFTSDHGDMMGSHRLLAKTVMYEESVRVPLLIKMAGQKESMRVRGPVSLIDLMPTLMELTGAAEAERKALPGESLLPLMMGDESTSDRDVFIVQQGPNWGGPNKHQHQADIADQIEDAVAAPVRTVVCPDGWKLCCSARGEHELYNLQNDPYEKVNMAKDPAQQARIKTLVKKILAWQKEVGDPFDLSRGLAGLT